MHVSRRSFTRGLGRALAVGLLAPLAGRTAVAWAADVVAEASVSATTTRVGEPVQLTLSLAVRGARAPTEIPWPKALIGNFEVSAIKTVGGWSGDLFAGPAGRINTRKVSAVITPKVAGTFELGFAVEIDGKTIESNVPVLEVLAADATLPEPPAGRVPTDAPGPVFLWATLDKEQVYVGEQLTYALDVYERRSFLGIHLRKPPTFTDFFTEELPEGETTVERVGGVEYRVRPGLRRALFPQRAGTLEVGAAELSVGGRQRILSPALTLEVLPLPGEGRPARFSPNNVGRFTIAATVDRTTLAANEPVTLRVTIAGEGNVKLVDPGPWPELPGVRRYEPKIETTLRKGAVLGGERRYEFLLIPERAGELTIPAHELAFFDPAAARYEVVRTEPIVLTVAGDEAPAPAPAPTPSPDGERLSPLVLGDALPRHVPRERWLTPSRWLYGMLAVPTIAAAGLGGAALWRRFGADEQSRARARRRQRHRALIDTAEHAVESGQGFHGTLGKLLQELAVERAGAEGVGLPRPELLRLLAQQGVPASDIERLRDLLDRCDAARFGAHSDTREDRQALLEEVLDLVRTSRLAKEGA
jgi:hypothetical protein